MSKPPVQPPGASLPPGARIGNLALRPDIVNYVMNICHATGWPLSDVVNDLLTFARDHIGSQRVASVFSTVDGFVLRGKFVPPGYFDPPDSATPPATPPPGSSSEPPDEQDTRTTEQRLEDNRRLARGELPLDRG